MYISLSFAVIQCNGNNNKFTHHHHSLICVRPHYFLTSHFVTRVPCCCCCEWCDVAVDLQTDKTQSSDTWWARSAARECCLRPGPGGNTLTLTRVWSVCVHTQNAFEIKYFLQNCTSAISLRCLGFIILLLLYFWLRCVYQAQCGPPGQWGWGDHMGHAPVWAGDQGVSHGAGLSVTQTGLVSMSAASSGATMWCHVTGITMSWSEHLQGQSIGISSCSKSQPYYKMLFAKGLFCEATGCRAVFWPSLSFKLSKFLSQSCFASPRFSRDFSPSHQGQSSCKPAPWSQISQSGQISPVNLN